MGVPAMSFPSALLRCVLTPLVILGLCAPPLAAQDATARVIGVVTDPTGSVVPKAKVTVPQVPSSCDHAAPKRGGSPEG